MTTSRRGFLSSLRGCLAAGLALKWPLTAVSRDVTFEPSGFGQGDGLIRLNNNENPYGPSTKVADAIKSSLGMAHCYARMEYSSLAERIAAFHNVKQENVLLGCGSTEILRMAACAFLGYGKQLVQASPTFEAMEYYARAVNSEVLSVHLTSGFSLNLEGMLARTAGATKLVYICNPNNPTASLTPRKDLETFVAKLPASTVVIIDEAYHQYVNRSGMYVSFIDHPLNDDRIIVTRTFSTAYGLAGLRLGYAVASPKLIQQMRKFTTEDNINAVVLEAAAVALDDTAGVRQFVQQNENERQEFFNQAMARAFKPIDSHANFVMMDTFHPADVVIQDFHKNKILIGPYFPAMDTYIRVSLGRSEDMRAFWRTWDGLSYLKSSMAH